MLKTTLKFSPFLILLLFFLTSVEFANSQGLSGIYNPVEGRFSSLGEVISKALPVVFGLVAFLAVVVFAIGAIRYITSRGDPKATEGARGTMTGAVIGFIIVLGATAVSGVLSSTLGLGLFGSPLNPPAPRNGAFDLSCAFRLSKDGDCVGVRYSNFGDLVTVFLLLLISIGALVFFFMLIWSGIRYMLARGDEKAVGEARSTLGNAFVGLLLLIAAFVIIRLIATTLFGFESF